MSDEPFRIMRTAGSDAEARRNAGAYGASAYDVQNTGPSVMDTLGLMGFLVGGPVGPATAKFAGQLGGAAQRGTDWARAQLFEHFAPGFNHSAAGMASKLRPTITGGSYMPETLGALDKAITGAEARGINDISGYISPQAQHFLNAVLRQRRPDFDVIPGGKP